MKNSTLAQVCTLALALISASANAMDEKKRQIECALIVDPTDDSAISQAIRLALRTGESPDPRLIIRATQSTLDGGVGRIFHAKDHKPPRPAHLQDIRTDWRDEAEWWYNPGARELQAGDQFVTWTGEHRWTKVVAASKEVWRGPDGLLVGDIVGQMTHYDAQRIDQALKALYDHAQKDGSGQWKWPDGFTPMTFLKHEMSRSVNATDLPGSDPYNSGSHDVGGFYEPLMESIGWVLEPNLPWRLPVQHGDGIENPGLTRELSSLRNQSALEVLNATSDRLFYSSWVYADSSFSACVLVGNNGEIGPFYRDVSFGSVRVAARQR